MKQECYRDISKKSKDFKTFDCCKRWKAIINKGAY